MKCKQAEKIIIEEIQNKLDVNTKSKFESHLFQCPKCLNFKENHNDLRLGLKKLQTPSPSGKLVEQTKTLCYEKLLRQDESLTIADQKSKANETPLTVWIAFTVLLGLFLFWALPVLKDYVEDQVVTKNTIYLLMIVIQNVIALIYAPVLFRIFKLKKLSINYC
jgi:uncharacterized membrane protein